MTTCAGAAPRGRRGDEPRHASRRLELHGYTVTQAEGGRPALDLLDRRPFDLVLLDVMMPEVNGLDVLRRLRATHAAADLPVIMVTAKNQGADVVEAF